MTTQGVDDCCAKADMAVPRTSKSIVCFMTLSVVKALKAIRRALFFGPFRRYPGRPEAARQRKYCPPRYPTCYGVWCHLPCHLAACRTPGDVLCGAQVIRFSAARREFISYFFGRVHSSGLDKCFLRGSNSKRTRGRNPFKHSCCRVPHPFSRLLRKGWAHK